MNGVAVPNRLSQKYLNPSDRHSKAAQYAHIWLNRFPYVTSDAGGLNPYLR